MTTWSDFEQEEPEFAAQVRQCLDAHRHHVLATLRRDGSPRVSGMELSRRDGELWLAGMPKSVKFVDLRRDPRLAIHSASEDPPAWSRDVKISGRAVEATDEPTLARFREGQPPDEPQTFELFRVEIDEVVTVRMGDPADHLVLETWRPSGGGVTRVERR